MSDEIDSTWSQLLNEVFAVLRAVTWRDLEAVDKHLETARLLVKHIKKNNT